MIKPPYLKRGDKIAIVSPARKTSPEEVVNAIRVFEGWGLEVVEGRHLYASCNQFAGSDEQRSADLQQMLDDPSVRAVICSRGGYGTVRIIDRLDFSGFVNHPKWLIGYSDVTVLHSHINRHFNTETLHSLMPVNFKEGCGTEPSVVTLKKALFGKQLAYRLPVSANCRSGVSEAELVGGNLSILYSLTNTNSDVKTSGKILFLEDVDEYLYHIDRMMMNLKRSGVLENLAGLIVGSMTKMQDNKETYGKSAYDIIRESVEEYSYPVYFGFPAGHQEDNRALILGRRITMHVDEELLLSFQVSQ